MKKKEIFQFIQQHDLGVLSTVSLTHAPEAAVIKFTITPKFEIIFNTYNTYRKYKNLQKNSKVALVVGGEQGITVQYEGNAMELKGPELQKYMTLFHQKHPKSQWHTHPETRFFKIIPTWLRYSDVRDFEKRKIIEINSF